MFNSGILDVVIGVVVVYLQLALVCTAVSEFVAMALRKRAKELEKGIRGLLTNPELVAKFYEHPLIKGLRPDERKPSYIPSRTFSLALLDIVRRPSFDGAVTAATQAATNKAEVQSRAQAAVEAANKLLAEAAQVLKDSDAAVTTATQAEKPAALKKAQDVANQEAAAKAQVIDAQTKLDAAVKAKTDALAFLAQVTKDVAEAKQAEAAAKTAEDAADKAAKEKKPDADALQTAATAARKKANEAAEKLAPNASSLLTEARANVAGFQSDIVPPQLKTALLALMDNAGTNLNKVQANVEQWFDDAMDRVSGAYKRKSQVFVVIIAVLMTVLANVDTLQVADSLSHDKAVRDSLVAAAPELAKKAAPTPTPTPVKEQTPGATGGAGTAGAGGGGGGSTANPPASPTPNEPSITSIKASLDELNKLGLPIGYIRVCTGNEEKVADSCKMAAEALTLVSDNKAKLKKAKVDLDKAESDLKTAKDDQTKITNDITATDATRTAAQTALSKAQPDRDKAKTALDTAQTTLDSSEAELEKAQDAYNQAVGRAEEVKQFKTEADKAEAEAKANPTDVSKQKVAKEARAKAEFTPKCPQCRKESELTAEQLKRRLPTTHGLSLKEDTKAALGALFGDIGNLIYAHWLGWLLTAMAVSLGAPFWFDTLNRLMVIRSTVKPHEKSREQESKDNPDEDDAKKKKT
jgi:DNA repair exonuclease SbcCD ATPase subunit